MKQTSILWVICVDALCFMTSHGALTQWGRRFLIYQEHAVTEVDQCGIEVHIITDFYLGTLIDMMTPFKSKSEGGFRKSFTIRRHEAVRMCAPLAKKKVVNAKSGNVIVLESDNAISVSITVRTLEPKRFMYQAYPTEVAGTHYDIALYRYFSFVLMATSDRTDIQLYTTPNKNDLEANGEEIVSSNQDKTVVLELRLRKYQAYVIPFSDEGPLKDLTKVALAASKPIVLLVSKSDEDPSAPDEPTVDAALQAATETWGKSFVFRYPPNSMTSLVTLGVIIKLPNGPASIEIRNPGHKAVKVKATTETPTVFLEKPKSTASSDVTQVITTEPALITLFIQTSFSGGATLSSGLKIPPQEQHYNFYMWSIPDDGLQTILYVVMYANQQEGLRLRAVNGTDPVLPVDVHGDDDVFQARECPLPGPGTYVLTHDHPMVVFGAFLERVDKRRKTRFFSELGMRFSPINTPNCTETEMVPDDGLDNDCNGQVDEDDELDPDADKDGILNEDVALGRVRGGLSVYMKTFCDGPCDNGMLVKRRLCNNPPPSKGGEDCEAWIKHTGQPCNTSDTLCLQNCEGYMYGLTCEKSCPVNCAGRCDRHSGNCEGRCGSGFQGPKCDLPCHRGYAGKICGLRCSDMCSSKNCHPVTLRCAESNVSLVTLWMSIACLIIFIGCPAISTTFYFATLYADRAGVFAEVQEEQKPIVVNAQIKNYDYDETDEEDDDDFDEDDENEDWSSSSSSVESVRRDSDLESRMSPPGARRDVWRDTPEGKRFAAATRNVIHASRLAGAPNSSRV